MCNCTQLAQIMIELREIDRKLIMQTENEEELERRGSTLPKAKYHAIKTGLPRQRAILTNRRLLLEGQLRAIAQNTPAQAG